MYALLIDAGNTRIKWRLLKEGQCQSEGILTGTLMDDLTSKTLLGWPPVEMVKQVLVASVIEQPVLQQLLADLYSKKVRWLHHPLASTESFRHCYIRPERLGVDRWLALLGARTHSQQGVLVVDAGTALTIDLMSISNEHQGGFIVPGVQMAQNALFNNTAKIKPFADDQKTRHIDPGQDTYSCVLAGIQRQRLALVQSVLVDFPQYVPFVCGGDGHWLAEQLNLHYYNNLVLDGMESLCAGSL